jgi:hypothetical protein
MIEDFLRAWRHVFKYVLGLIVAIELGALWLGPNFFRNLKPNIAQLVYGNPNTLIVLTGLALVAVTGSIVADMLFVVPFYGLAAVSRFFLKRKRDWLSKKGDRTMLSWWDLALCHPGRALQLAAESDEAYLIRHLRLASLANIAKDHTEKALELSGQDIGFFHEAMATLAISKNHELLWWANYSFQFTQERRELDACQVESTNARSIVAAAILALVTVVRVRTLLLPAAVPLVALFAASAAVAAFRAWLDAKQRMVYYMLGLILMGYLWGEQGDIEDREAV